MPALVVNVQRGGPGLGGIQPSQSDYFQATRSAGHGDFRMIVLAPSSVQEMADLTIKGFELADKYRMTAMILSDGILGQMMEPVQLNFGDIKQHYKPWAVTGTGCQREKNVISSLYLKPEQLEDKIESVTCDMRTEENETMVEEYQMDSRCMCRSLWCSRQNKQKRN